MTKKTEVRIFHCRASGLVIPGVPSTPTGTATGRILMQGERFEVDDALYAETLDANGISFLDLDAPAQVTRWGKVRFLPGEPPEDMQFAGDDEGHQYKRALKAREYAEAISDPRERKAALQAVSDEFGAVLHPVAQGPQIIPGR